MSPIIKPLPLYNWFCQTHNAGSTAGYENILDAIRAASEHTESTAIECAIGYKSIPRPWMPPHDAANGFAWCCPDCSSWATLTDNAFAHQLATKHDHPKLSVMDYDRAPQSASLHCAMLDNYMIAPGNEGPLAYDWSDKPHRLVYDLVRLLNTVRATYLPIAEGKVVVLGPAIRDGRMVYWEPIPSSHYSISVRMQKDGIQDSLKKEQGFITSDGRFVDRDRACKIAIAAGQVDISHSGFQLYSEDLWEGRKPREGK